MSAVLLEALAQRTQAAHEGIANLAAVVARMKSIEVGQRVVFKFAGGETTLHGFVVELARRPADEVQGAWVRMIGFPAWVHFEPLANLHAVCGICQDCVRLNDRPRCTETPRRVQP
ncbi:MAG: hypothetical protein RL268_501 [Pseudomonadota bacterium]|jgi:hypothetical protein